MATSSTRQRTFKGRGFTLPKPIISLQLAVDRIEDAKAQRAALADQIEKEKEKLAVILRRHAKKLAKIGRNGILYKQNGYVVTLTDHTKVDAKVEKEA